MILKLKYPALLVILSSIFCSCEKEYSIEGNVIGGTAVFTFPGAPANCNDALVTGTYEVGSALGASNVVTISVDVTTLGTYVVATGTTNGITFTGSGTFSATGPQSITLTGNGIPLAAGTFSYTPGTDGCPFQVTVTGGGGGSGTGVFTYDGAPNACASAIPAGTYLTNNALTAANTLSVAIDVTTLGSWSVATTVVNGFSFSGSGTFTVKGAQTITLTGAGTPAAVGSFDFTLPNNGCSFSITVGAGNPPTDFLKCTIDGVDKTFNENLTGTNPDPTLFAFVGDETTASNTPSFQVAITKSPVVTTGNYDKISATNTSTYCQVAFFDGTATTAWATGLLQAGGFTVNITSYTANRIEGTFSGTLYDNDGVGTNSKVITAGQFSIPY